MSARALLTIFVCLLVLNGCASTVMPTINEGVIRNQAGSELKDVSVKHNPTNNVASFAYILAGTDAKIGFSERQLLAESSILSWQENGQRFSQSFNLLQLSEQLQKGQTYKVVYIIYRNGRATVSFRPAP